MAQDYRERLDGAWRIRVLSLMGELYNVVGTMAEQAVAHGMPSRTTPRIGGNGSESAREKAAIVTSYLAAVGAGELRCVDLGGVGRVLNPLRSWGTLRHHARVRSDLRRRGARFCEVLITSRRAPACDRARLSPVPMPLFYLDRNGTIEKLQCLRRDEVSFPHTDKSI